MSRLFFSLYAFIAISIILLGFTLDRLFSPESPLPSPSQKALLALLSENKHQPDTLLALLRASGASITTLQKSQFAMTNTLGEALRQSQIVDGLEDGFWTVFIPLDNRDIIKAQFSSMPDPSLSWQWYSLLFFTLLAVAIAIWVFPVGRDLNRLKAAVRTLNESGMVEVPTLPIQSPLRSLADAYNSLNTNIAHLLKHHKSLAGAITHEFKTPLARLRFALASPGYYGEKQLTAIRSDISELEQLVGEMLDFSQLDTHAPTLYIEDIPALSFCKECVARFQPQTNIILQCTGEDALLQADATLLMRAVENLITNGIRHAKSTVEVSVSFNTVLMICVDDDGEGVAESDKKHVFEPFFRSDSHRSRQSGGSGLGLAIVNRVMHLHGGQCALTRSRLGGARFELRFDDH